MKRLQQGFTLIELMIVVAIVGILAAIALPAYQDYVIRSKMSEGVAAAAACKTSISEYVSTKNAWPTSADNAGCSTLATQYVASLAVADGGVITVTTTNTGSKLGSSAGDCVLVLTAQFTALPDITGWSGCHSACDAKYVPSNFR
jgi:type IV pilus assembly protein PilA